MTIKELKELISEVPDDFIFEIEVEKKVPKSELEKRDYKYPIDSERCNTNSKDYDIGWMEKKIKLNIMVSEL